MNKVFIFTLPTCAPCTELKKQIASKKEYFDLANVEIMELDMSKPNDFTLDLGSKYNVRSCPTTVVLHRDETVYYNGTMVKQVATLIGLIDAANEMKPDGQTTTN